MSGKDKFLSSALHVVSQSVWWKFGAVSGATAILTGAFGAHALKSHISDPKLLKTWETAAHYHLVHSTLFLAVPFTKKPMLVGSLLATGTMLFSGSLYALVLTDNRKLGAITPIGGLTLVAAWLSLML